MSLLGPQWTEKPSKMRILDPLGTESTINRLQGRLLYPVNSIAITERLRYLSFWAWVTDHVEQHDSQSRQLYEKIYLFANVAHDCDDVGTYGKGIVSASRSIDDGTGPIIRDFYDSSKDSIDISADTFTLTTNRSGFDQYYKGILYNLLLFEDEWTLSKPGQTLATAFDTALDIDFAEVQTAVEAERVSIDLVERLAQDGCLCLLTEQERDILTRAFLGLFTEASSWEDVEFRDSFPSNGLRLEPYLKHERLAERLIEFDESIESEDEAIDPLEIQEVTNLTDLEQYMISGQHVFTRGSLLLMLYAGYWVTERKTDTPRFGNLSDIRELWRLVFHSEYFSQACQAILIALYEAVRVHEQVTSDEILDQILSSPAFDTAINQGLHATFESESGEPDTLQQVKDIIYFGDAFLSPVHAQPQEPTEGEDTPPVNATDNWEALHEHLTATIDKNAVGPRSERTFLSLIQQIAEKPRSIEKSTQLVAYATLLLLNLQARYTYEFATDQFSPYRQWFRETERYPSPALLWDLNIDISQPLSTVTKQFIDTHVVDQYFTRLYEKIADKPGKSPQVMSLDADGTLSYERSYNSSKPNLPTLKYDRLGDIFFELGWIQEDSLHQFDLTDRGEVLLNEFHRVEESQ